MRHGRSRRARSSGPPVTPARARWRTWPLKASAFAAAGLTFALAQLPAAARSPLSGGAAQDPAAAESNAGASKAEASKAPASTAAAPRDGAKAAGSTDYAPVVPGRPLEFPRDYGSHPDFRTEWWYVTGWLQTGDGRPLGFQVTFFRTRPGIAADNPSTFAPRQILIAHAALSDPALGRLRTDQRVRRAGLGLADALTGDTRVWIDDWSLARTPAVTPDAHGVYRTTLAGEGFALALELRETEPLLLNGESGFSKKGPAAGAASYYYSEPHLAASGRVTYDGRSIEVSGDAWLDHEWSSEYLDPESQGWDWIGLDLDDGGAIMAFRMRGRDGGARWAGGTWRAANGETRVLAPGEIVFQPGRRWTSPRSGTSYPVEWQVRLAGRAIDLAPLMSDQENDARLSTGAIYWEGAVRASEQGRRIGHGYLELTGYRDRLELR